MDAENSIYDWWGRNPWAFRVLYAAAFFGREWTFRDRSIELLAPSPGDRVLEVGCGPGNSFDVIRTSIDRAGCVVGLDISSDMAETAHERIRTAGWTNVHVVRGDARRPPVPDRSFDVAYATMSISSVPDPGAAIEATAAALRPGGRFVILDARPFQWKVLRPLNPLIKPVATWATNWVPDIDLVAALRRSFQSVEVEAYNGGSIIIAHAQKADVG